MNKRHNHLISKKSKYIVFLIFGLIIMMFSINFFHKNVIFNNFFQNTKDLSDILTELPKKYQTEIDISYKNGNIKGQLTRAQDNIIFEIKEPSTFSGLQIEYKKDETYIKYKNLESKTKNNKIIETLPISKLISIENMLYSGFFNKNKYVIKDDELCIEDKYINDKFFLNIDLRKNKLKSINIENDNIIANYHN